MSSTPRTRGDGPPTEALQGSLQDPPAPAGMDRMTSRRRGRAQDPPAQAGMDRGGCTEAEMALQHPPAQAGMDRVGCNGALQDRRTPPHPRGGNTGGRTMNFDKSDICQMGECTGGDPVSTLVALGVVALLLWGLQRLGS